MIVRPASEITLAHDGNVVRLVATLRAATTLEQLEGGFPAVLRRIEEMHTATIRAVIEAGATSLDAAQAFLSALVDVPLATLRRITLPACLALLGAVMTPDMGQADTAPATHTAKPITWAALYSELFGIGTGWLGWSPAETWAATLPEIVAAFDAHAAKLRAIHGGEETPSGPSEEQRQANAAAGLDPEFNRAGLHALRTL